LDETIERIPRTETPDEEKEARKKKEMQGRHIHSTFFYSLKRKRRKYNS